MAAEESDRGGGGGPPIRLMNFVSEDQLEEARRNRGPRVEDGTAQRDRPLFEILKENKDKKDAEFNERFKHRPPKALDEDETEFLDTLEMSKREYERQLADEEAQELKSFQAAVATQSTIVEELKETPPPVPKVQDEKLVGKRKPPARPFAMVVKIKPQAKKTKLELRNAEEAAREEDTHKDVTAVPESSNMLISVDNKELKNSVMTNASESSCVVANGSLVSYSDESEDDDDDD